MFEIMVSSSFSTVALIHRGQDKTTADFLTTISSAVSWMKMYTFRLRCHWSLLPMVQLTIFRHWLGWWLGAGQATSSYLNWWWLVYTHQLASMSYWSKRKPRVDLHWDGNVINLTISPLMVAQEVVKMTTCSAASDENFIWMTTFPFQCHTNCVTTGGTAGCQDDSPSWHQWQQMQQALGLLPYT